MMRASISASAILFAAAVLGTAVDARPQAEPGRAPAPVVVAAGTVVNVRLAQAIDVDVAQAGMTFKGRVDDPVSI